MQYYVSKCQSKHLNVFPVLAELSVFGLSWRQQVIFASTLSVDWIGSTQIFYRMFLKTTMRSAHRFLVAALLSGGLSCAIATLKTGHLSNSSAETQTYVVSHEFCENKLTAEEKMSKSSIRQVHTYAELRNDLILPASFTICSSLMTTECPSTFTRVLFNILDEFGNQLLAAKVVMLDRAGKAHSIFKIAFSQGTTVSDLKAPLFSYQWMRSCLAIDTKSGVVDWVVDGTLVLSTKSEEITSQKAMTKNLKLILGAESFKDSTEWFALSNKVTNLNIFSSLLSKEKMEKLTKGGSCAEEGDYLAWKDMEWILHSQARLETVEKKEACEGEPWAHLYFAPFAEMDSCMHHCQNLGSRVPPVTSLEDWKTLQNFLVSNLYEKVPTTPDVWLPITDVESEGVWKDFYTSQMLENYTAPWIGSRPNGGRSQNCARVMGKEYWGDESCLIEGATSGSPKYSCLCSNEERPILKLRGLCPQSVINMHYQPMNDWKDIRKVTLQGIYTTIAFDNRQEIWTLAMTRFNVTGFSKAPHTSFTLGKHNWTVVGDKSCNGGEPYTTELKMSRCNEEEFTCDSGQCVSMTKRCNQLPDCRDQSDENNCDVLVLKRGYNKNVPPIDLDDLKVNISVSLNLLKLVDINEDDYSIEIQFGITLKWRENRATYQNLKSTDNLNALTQQDIAQLWLPEVIYENTDQKETTRLGEFGNGEWKTKVVVKREGNFTRGGPQIVDEIETFSGSENSIVMSQTYTHQFQCSYQLSRYPFDTQVKPNPFPLLPLSDLLH